MGIRICWAGIPRGDGRRSCSLTLTMDAETVDGCAGHADREGLEKLVATMMAKTSSVFGLDDSVALTLRWWLDEK